MSPDPPSDRGRHPKDEDRKRAEKPIEEQAIGRFKSASKQGNQDGANVCAYRFGDFSVCMYVV